MDFAYDKGSVLMDLYKMPKLDLHCHLDGSMELLSTQNILKSMGMEYSLQELEKELKAPKECNSLAEYLKSFDIPIKCIQTEEGLFTAAKELALSAAKENVKYLEVRFAPSFSTSEGLSIRQILESVEKGLEFAKNQSDIRTGIIVCGMRNLDNSVNLDMLKQARQMLGYGVVACDLAGDEKAYKTSLFYDFFELARKYDMPFTIHSGECGSVENIKTAIDYGAKRLGHGIAMEKDVNLMKLCADKKIGVELCPTSNLQTKAVKDFDEYPYDIMKKNGVMVSINTDNRTVSETTSTKEFERIVNKFNLSDEDLRKIYTDSVDMIFTDDDCKEYLLRKWED